CSGHPVGKANDPPRDAAPVVSPVDQRLSIAGAECRGQGIPQRDGILDAGIHALAARRTVHMRCIADDQNTSVMKRLCQPMMNVKAGTPDDVTDAPWRDRGPAGVEKSL